MTPLRNDRGIALVITLLVVAILAITVLEFAFSVHVDAHMGRNALNSLQATLLARSGINLGEAALAQDSELQFDSSWVEDWGNVEALNNQVVPPPNMLLRVKIVDEMGKLNINLTRPMRPAVECQSYADKPPTATYRMWINALRDIDEAVADAVDTYWALACERQGLIGQTAQGGTPGARTTPTVGPTQGPDVTPSPQDVTSPFHDFPSLDDAAALGIPAATLRRLRPYITALPTSAVGGVPAKVNANTALEPVLNAIIKDADQVKELMSRRQDAGLRDADLGFLTQASGQQQGQQGTATTNPRAMLGTRSSFFLIRASAIINPNPVTGRGGVRRSASMLVQRTQAPGRPGTPVGASGTGAPVRWTLKQLDWQKEGGAALFTEQGDEDLTGDSGLNPSQSGTVW